MEVDGAVECFVAGGAEEDEIVGGVVGVVFEEDDVVGFEGVGGFAVGGFAGVAGAAADAAGGVVGDLSGEGVGVVGVGMGCELGAGSLPAGF